MEFFSLAASNLLTPMALFFALGLFAAFIRSDLSVPEAVAKSLALYLMLAIGFKGGAEMAAGDAGWGLIGTLLVAVFLSLSLPLVAYGLLKRLSDLSPADRAAIAGCFGSISIVTFVAGTQVLADQGLSFEGYLVAAAAAMEAPAILTALWLAARGTQPAGASSSTPRRTGALHEAATNGSVVLLIGAFVIGWVTGAEGLETVSSFIVDPFKGVLCLFLLDMGLVAGRGLKEAGGRLPPKVVVFGLTMPLIGAMIALPFAALLPLSVGGAMLLLTLAASASYIAVPAAMRLALPEAKASIYLTLSIGVTFPFNLILGLPLYLAFAKAVAA